MLASFSIPKKQLTLRSMLVSQSNTPHAASTAIGVEMSSSSPIPKLRAEIRVPKLEGNFNAFHYIALDFKIVVEITPKPERPLDPPGPLSAQPRRQTAPSGARAAEPHPWTRILGAGLVITGGAIVVATIVEDFMTVGAGAADDPASLAAAGGMLARGFAMLGIAGASGLPLAPNAAHLSLRTTVALPDGFH